MDLPTAEELIPKAFEHHTLILLRWGDDQPELSEEESDRLFIEHLAYLRDRIVEGVLLVNGPLRDQTDERLRGMSIYGLPLDEALVVARRDPMVTAGWFAIEGAEWHLAKGAARFARIVDGVAVDSDGAGSS